MDDQLDAMKAEEKRSGTQYTGLFVRICEEGGAFTVTVRLSNLVGETEPAWGEEIAESFEAAVAMVSNLAEQFSIQPECVEIEIRMNELTQGSVH
jgi:hypothetical protein